MNAAPEPTVWSQNSHRSEGESKLRLQMRLLIRALLPRAQPWQSCPHGKDNPPWPGAPQVLRITRRALTGSSL